MVKSRSGKADWEGSHSSGSAEDDDGVHGGRMKPLTSFALNRGMLPPQNRKLRIKLRCPDPKQPATMDGAAPKPICGAQDKGSGGLVPLCPGTTQIRGMKRKTVRPTDLKSQGGKRNRLPFGSGKAKEKLKEGPAGSSVPGPAEETKRDNSYGMNMLLMALRAADPKCQPLTSPSPTLARPTCDQAATEVKYASSTKRVVGVTTANRNRPQNKVNVRVDAKEEDDDSSGSDEELDEETEKYPVMRSHWYKPKFGPRIRLIKEVESSSSDEEPKCAEESWRKDVKTSNRDCITSQEGLVMNGKNKATVDVDAKEQDDDSSESDEELEEETEKYPVMRPHWYKPKFGPMIRLIKEVESSSSDEEPECAEESSTKDVKKPNIDCLTSRETLSKVKDRVDVQEDDDNSSGSDDELNEQAENSLAVRVMRPHRYKPKAEESRTSDEDPDCTEETSRKDVNMADSDYSTSLRNSISKEMVPQILSDLGKFPDSILKVKHASLPAQDNGKENGKPGKGAEGNSGGCQKELDLREGDLYKCATEEHSFKGTSIKDLVGAKPDNLANNSEVERVCNGSLIDNCAKPPHQYNPAKSATEESDSTNPLERRKENKSEKSSTEVDRVDTVIKLHLPGPHPSQARVLSSQMMQLKSQVRTQTTKHETGSAVCYDGEDGDNPKMQPLPSKLLLPSQAKVFLAQFMQLKSTIQCETRNESEKVKISGSDEEGPIIMKPELNKPLPPQTKVFLSEEQSVSQRALEECRITVPSSSTVYIHEQQHKESEHEPVGQDGAAGMALLEGDQNRIVKESPKNINRECNDVLCLKDSTWGKYAGERQQAMKMESSGISRSPPSDHQSLNHTRKRKSSDLVSTCCIVPKQVHFSTASRPSVGSVVVECLPPSTEEDKHRAPFCDLQNRDSLWTHNSLPLPDLKSAKSVAGVLETDKENRFWVLGTAASNCLSRGVKASCELAVEGGAGAPGVRIAASFSGNSLQPLQNSRLHWGSVDSTTSHSSDLRCNSGSFPQQQQEQQRPSATPGAGSFITRASNGNEENETRHAIAGITVKRRSWEALKAAEYFANRRFDPKTDAPHHHHSLPSIPSRFQAAQYLHHVPRSNFGAHFNHFATAPPAASIGVTANNQAVVADKKFSQRRGPKLGRKQEKLSTKVLNRNLESYVQLKDASCPAGGIDSNRLHSIQNGCYGGQLPRPYTNSGITTVPALKVKRRRNQKTLVKEKLKTVHVKASSSVCNFKPLSEPSGLLGKFNPGIIQRVRNSVQIRAILGALIGAPSCKKARDVTLSPRVPKEKSVTLCKQENPVQVEALFGGQETLHKEGNWTPVETLVDVKEVCWTQAETTVEVRKSLQTHELLAMRGRIEREQVPDVQGLMEKEVLDLGELLRVDAEQREPPTIAINTDRKVLPEAAGLASFADEVINTDFLHEQSQPLTQGPSSVSVDPDHAEYAEDDEQELRPMFGTDSCPTAAGLAGRWLELLTLDVKGRLSALKQSRLRVQRTLRSEQLNPEGGIAASVMASNASSSRSAIHDANESQQSVCSDATAIQPREGDSSGQQVNTWRALITNMDDVLGSEATKLESWLWQIKQMQAFCPSSNQQPSFSGPEKSHLTFCNGGPATLNLEFGKQPSQRWPLTIEETQKEIGFAASAASIMSTANFLTKLQGHR